MSKLYKHIGYFLHTPEKANCESFEAQKAHQKCIPRISFNAVFSRFVVPDVTFSLVPPLVKCSIQFHQTVLIGIYEVSFWLFAPSKHTSGHWSSIINEIINLSFRSSKHIWNIHLGLSLLSNELEVYWILNGPLYNWKPFTQCWPSFSKRFVENWLNSQTWGVKSDDKINARKFFFGL